jgi:exopolysaccharide production protein ExoZ
MIRNLQATRAVAAFMVLLYHFSVHYMAHVTPAAQYVTFGAAGVDLFFVISGFIMVVTTLDERTGPGDFLTKRISRIVPIYWIITLLLFAIALTGLRPIGIMRVEPSWLVRSLLFIPFDRDGRVEPINPVGWTLNYEMYFYVLFTLALVIKQELARVIVLCGSMLASTLFVFGSDLGLYAKFYTNPIILEFVFGCVLGYGFYRTRDIGLKNHSVFLALILLGFGVIAVAQAATIYLGTAKELAGFTRPLVWGVAGLLIVSGAVFLERSGRIVRADWLISLGNASYSIYLIHELILHAASKLAGVFASDGFFYLLAIFVIGVSLSTTIGLLLYQKVELPLNRSLRQLLPLLLLNPARARQSNS